MELTVLLDNPCAAMPLGEWTDALRTAFNSRLRLASNKCISGYTDPQDAGYGWLAKNLGLKDAATLAALLASRGAVKPEFSYYEVSPCHWALARDHAILTPVQALTVQQAEDLIATANAAIRADSTSAASLMQDEYGWSLQTLFDLPGPSFVSALKNPTQLAYSDDPAGQQARRLLNLIQMAWHEHPVNEARQLQGQPAINALWLHGGLVPELPPHPIFDCIMDTQHRARLLAKALRQPLCSSLNPQARHILLWLDTGRDSLSFSGHTAKDQLKLQIEQLSAIVQALPAGTKVSLLNCQANQLQRIKSEIIQPGWYWRLRDTFLPSRDVVECLVMTTMLAA